MFSLIEREQIEAYCQRLPEAARGCQRLPEAAKPEAAKG